MHTNDNGSNDANNVTVARERKKGNRDLWVQTIDLCEIGKQKIQQCELFWEVASSASIFYLSSSLSFL